MSRFGFVTPNDPPRASGPPKTTQKPAGRPPRTQKNARKIAKAPRLIFQNWKARSRIKRIPNKLGCKRETSERCSNPLESESLCSSASQETALQSLLIFRYDGHCKNRSWDVPKFLEYPDLYRKSPLCHSDGQRVDFGDACNNNFYVPLEILMTCLITLSKLRTFVIEYLMRCIISIRQNKSLFMYDVKCDKYKFLVCVPLLIRWLLCRIYKNIGRSHYNF
jgi:hypothetical protein